MAPQQGRGAVAIVKGGLQAKNMMGIDHNMRPVAAVALLGALLPGLGLAQGLGQPADFAKACERWLASDHTSEELVGKAVTALLETPKVGLAWLGARLPSVQAAPNKPRSKGFLTLCTKTTLEFLRRTQKSGMVFVGQYNDLAALQPFASEFLFDLLLDTPDWYPFTFRVRLVAPLRDLQLRLPASERVDGIVALIKDRREPQGLRNALAAMLYQWGIKKHALRISDRLVAATAEGDAEDRVQVMLQLADYRNLLRDYGGAARVHRTAQALAKNANVTLLPIAWYAAACVHSLQGEVERGIEALERCVQMHESPHLDKSLRLERKLFERDPEIALLRKDARFAGLVKRAFGDEPAKDEKADKQAKDGL